MRPIAAAMIVALAVAAAAAQAKPEPRLDTPRGDTAKETHKDYQAQLPDDVPADNRRGRPMPDYSTALFVFGCALAVLTLAAGAGVIFVMVRSGKGWEDWNSLRVFVCVFGIGMVAFLIVAGYSANQMAGLVGLARIIQTPRSKAADQGHSACLSRDTGLDRHRRHTTPLPPPGEDTATRYATG